MDRGFPAALAAATGIGLASLLFVYGAVASFGGAPVIKETALPYLLVAVLSLVAVVLARAGAGLGPIWLLFAGPLFALGAFGQYLVTTVWAGPGVRQYLPTAIVVAVFGGAALAGLTGGLGWYAGERERVPRGRDRGLRTRLVGRDPRATTRYLAAGVTAASLVFIVERFAAGLGRPGPAVVVAVGLLAATAWGMYRRQWRGALAAAVLAAVTLAVLARGPAYELAWGALVVLPALAVERNDGAAVPLVLVGLSVFYLAAASGTATLGVGLGYVLRTGAAAGLVAALPVGGAGYLLGRALSGRPGARPR